MSATEERVLALVSGLPPHTREGWLMVTLQPCADDSGSEPRGHTFVLGGLVATADEWVLFTKNWQAALDEGPIKLDYFKMAEAMSFRGQFDKRHGWSATNRDKKIDDLIEIIRKHVRYGAWVSLRHSDFGKHLRSIPLPQRNLSTDSPYMFLYAQFVLMLCLTAQQHRGDCTFDFVFDQQHGFDTEAVLSWPGLKSFARTVGIGRYLAGAPVFRDEKKFLPLQGADLFAWEHRNHLFKNKTIIVPPTRRWIRLNTIRTFSVIFSGERLAEMHSPLLGLAAEFARQYPTAEMLFASKRSRRRTKVKQKRGAKL